MLTVCGLGCDLRLRVDAGTGYDDEVIDDGRGVDGKVVYGYAANGSVCVEDGFPLEEASGGRSDGAVFQGLPIGPAIRDGLLDVAGAGEDFISWRNLARFRRGRSEQVRRRRGHRWRTRAFQLHQGQRACRCCRCRRGYFCRCSIGQAEALLSIEVGDVGVDAVVLNAEDVTAIAGEGEQAVGTVRRERRRCRLCWTRVCAEPGLRRVRRFRFLRAGRCLRWRPGATGLDDGDGGGANALHGKRGQRIAGLVADAGGVDGAFGSDGYGGDFAPGGIEEHVALALGADAVDEAGAVRAGDQIALRIPCERANVLLRRI